MADLLVRVGSGRYPPGRIMPSGFHLERVVGSESLHLTDAVITEGTGHGYTVTHYVEPFASVSGASGDDDVQNGTAFTNASNPATPCTIYCALTNAVGPNVVQVGLGVYTVPRIDSGASGTLRWTPAYSPTGSGSSGNLLIFVAENPAAYTANTALRSKLRCNSIAGGDPGVNACITVGFQGFQGAAPGIEHAVFDGFWVDSDDGAYPFTYGQGLFGPDNQFCEFRRMVFTRGNDIDAGDNRAAIYSEAVRNCKVLDCAFEGGQDTTGMPHNNACINMYSSEDYTIEHNTFDDCNCPIYIKAEKSSYGGGPALSNSGTIRYNRMTNLNGDAIVVGESENDDGGFEIAHNLITDCNSGIRVNFTTNSTDHMANVHHNTIVGITGVSSDGGAGLVVLGGLADVDVLDFNNNIVATFSNANSGAIVTADSGSTTLIQSCNYNMFWNGGSTLRFSHESGAAIALAAWTAANGFDANSTTDDPEFTNAGAGDYTLAPGSPALTASSTSGPIGCYVTGSEEIGLRANPTY